VQVVTAHAARQLPAWLIFDVSQKMKNPLVRLLAILGLASPAVAAEGPPKEGECWSYVTRPGEEASFLVIRKIETIPKLGEVVHVSVFGLKITNPAAPKGYIDQAGHLPIAGASLRGSLKRKVQKKIPEVDWKEGYQMWLEAKGGVFTKPVSECVGFMEEAINRAKKG
jgi:hypothetical protein